LLLSSLGINAAIEQVISPHMGFFDPIRVPTYYRAGDILEDLLIWEDVALITGDQEAWVLPDFSLARGIPLRVSGS
jgi:hypothetical protein